MFDDDKKKNGAGAKMQGKEGTIFVLSENSVISGSINTNEPAVINGSVEGSVTVENTLVLGEKAVIKGPVYSQVSIDVNGSVNGDLKCKGPINLRPTSKVTGDVQCVSIVISKGAYFSGKVDCAEIE